MSIVPLRRVTLCGLAGEKDETLEGVQALGVIHLVPLRQAPPLEVKDPTQIRRAETAARHLKDASGHVIAYRPDTACDIDEVVRQILHNRARLRTLRDRREFLSARIEALSPWGDLVFPPVSELGGNHLWFYALPLRAQGVLARVDLPWQVVGRTPSTLLVAVISEQEPPEGLLPVARVHTGAVARSVLKRELEDVLIAAEQAEMERVELTRWRLVLAARLAAVADREDLVLASGLLLDVDHLFALQGWAPAEAVPALEAFAAARGLALETEVPGPTDRPPTLLRQPEALASGIDLTHFYASPAYGAWDPSVMVMASFALFFAMIMADAGYAAIIGIGVALYWRRLGQSSAGRRGRVMLAAIAGVGLVYGILCGSYFGVAPRAGGTLSKFVLLDVNAFDLMMGLSITVGVLHISIALAAEAWTNRGTGRAITALGWILTAWSGLAMALIDGVVGDTIAAIGLAAGLGLVAGGAFMSASGSGARGLLNRVGAGLLALTGITKLFGDVLSYLRLFALGLASASLADTFNTLAVGIKAAHPGIGFILALIVLAFGHGINFMLGLMSGVVHGLRLNFIEFFSWGLPEEGTAFRAFAKRDAS